MDVTRVFVSYSRSRVAVTATDREFDIWVWDLGRTTLTRATAEPAVDNHPAWTPDARRVIFSSERGGTRNLYWQAADGTGAAERLTDGPNLQNAGSVSPDGRSLIFTEAVPETDDDVMQLELDGHAASGRSCIPSSSNGMAPSRPTAAGSRMNRMIQAGSRFRCDLFPM